MRAIRRLLYGPKAAVSSAEAFRIAREKCEAEGWSWREPVEVNPKRGAWLVRTHVGSRGANAFITIDNQSGKVVRAEYYPR